MTNPDNVGGLRDALDFVNRQPCRCMSIAQLGERDYCDRCNAVRAIKQAELCRAAPAGGDVAVGEIGELNGTKLIVGRDEDALARLPKGTKLYTRPQDSAPAGSGEVEALASRLVSMSNGLHSAHLCTDLRRAAALLRKLQQGADYVVVPRVPTDEMETAHRMYGDTSDWWQAVIAASQGQEGGHALD